MTELRELQGTLWQCRPDRSRLAAQRISFREWPRAGRVFVCRDSQGVERRMPGIEAVEFLGAQKVRAVEFWSVSTRFELVAE